MDADLRHSDARAEQINFPGSADHLWNYRMHLEIEDLHTATKLNTALSQLLEDAGRAVL
jgi:4-alpha-glucanotransferase